MVCWVVDASNFQFGSLAVIMDSRSAFSRNGWVMFPLMNIPIGPEEFVKAVSTLLKNIFAARVDSLAVLYLRSLEIDTAIL